MRIVKYVFKLAPKNSRVLNDEIILSIEFVFET